MINKRCYIGRICQALVILLAFSGIVLFLKRDLLFYERGWFITQYGPHEDNLLFYTIYNRDKGLIVVDGGWEKGADYAREVINNLGGRVDAWILTHPHADHIGAFTSIYQDPQGIEIGDIYTVDMPSPEACLKRASWDSVEAYEKFLALDVPQLQYVHKGDKLNLCGLEFEIFSAYGDYVEKLSKDYINDGGMMFQVRGETESMLFCADVGKSLSDYLLKEWGDKLPSAYLQMGHHGFGGLKDDFYEKVNPRVAFFDAPDWLMFDTTGKYDTPENTLLMENMGAEIKWFQTAPNQIQLH